MRQPAGRAQADRERALRALAALREAIEAGALVHVEERPPRGVYASEGESWRCVAFHVEAHAYDAQHRANG